jgi:hypothetical protein
MEPRWKPIWVAPGCAELVGYAGALDVYRDAGFVRVVGPPERTAGRAWNHDSYAVVGSNLELVEQSDVHVEIDEMCEVYALCVKHGIIKLEGAA